MREISLISIGNQKKKIAIIFVWRNMIDANLLNKYDIDTLVNTAKPTLMGSHQGIDGAVHAAIDSFLPTGEHFRDKIQEELGSNTRSDRVRCPRGNAVITKGYGLCDYIIHAVGIPYDGDVNEKKDCSSSRVNTTESCYLEIMKIIKRSDRIKNIGIPIIGSGEYGFPFELAARIAISAIGSELVEWCKYDSDTFEMLELNTIYFFIYSNDQNKKNEYCDTVKDIVNELKPYFDSNRKVIFQSAFEAHRRYWNEVMRHDEARGYFSIAKKARILLLMIRAIFLVPMAFREWLDKKDWLKRRSFVERYAFYKVLLPLGLYCFYKLIDVTRGELNWFTVGAKIWIMYHMLDTITYLLFLIMLNDIQRPSANLIRSMIMLCVNYVQVAFDIAFITFISYKDILFRQALAFGLWGKEVINADYLVKDYIFVAGDTCIKFFFLSMVFGYFAGHMKPKKFRS